MELLQLHLHHAVPLTPQAVHEVGLQPRGVGAQAQIVIRVCTPDVGLEQAVTLVGEVGRPVQHRVVQRRQAAVVHQRQVGPGLKRLNLFEPMTGAKAAERLAVYLYQEDCGLQLAVKDCSVESGVA